MLVHIYYFSATGSILYSVTDFILTLTSGYSMSIVYTRTSLQNFSKLAGSHLVGERGAGPVSFIKRVRDSVNVERTREVKKGTVLYLESLERQHGLWGGALCL